jgi:predicted AlkP superfamily phosphohydrolase/phosphomutase
MKILLIGLDGGTFDYMDPWLDSGELPNLASLIDRGTRGILRSTFLPVTAIAWPSMLTGKNPGKHGIFDFETRLPDSYELVPSLVGGIEGDPLHLRLSRLGRRVAMINVPLTYPVSPVNGVMISGFTTPEGVRDWAWPRTLEDDLAKAGSPYPMHILHDLMRMEKLRRAGPEIERFIEGWGRFTDSQALVVRHLMEQEEYDFFMIVFSSTDHINHHTPDLDHMKRVYQQVDQAVGCITEVLDDDTVVLVVSDHGSAPLKHYIVLNRFLADLGLLAFRPEIASHYVGLAARRISRHWRSRASGLWSLLPASLRRLLSWPLLQLDDRLQCHYDNIDWAQTRAYARTGIGALYVNLRDREPGGTVAPGEEFEALRHQIIEALLELKDPETGELLIDEALRSDEAFAGPHVAQAPDIVFSRRNPLYRAVTGFASDPVVRSSEKRSQGYTEYGYHTREGVLIASGPGMCAGARIEEASIYDVAPTILHTLGLPVPRDVDGRVLLELFETPGIVEYTD